MSARREHRLRRLENRVSFLEKHLTCASPVTTNTGIAAKQQKKVYRPLAALFRKK